MEYLCTVTKQSELELTKIWNMDSCLKWKNLVKDKMGAECWWIVLECWYITCFAHGLQKYFRELGIKTRTIADNKLEELFQLSLRMFDTRLPPGVTVMSPFADDSSLTKIGVEVWSHLKGPNL
jgi:hypothetical protein